MYSDNGFSSSSLPPLPSPNSGSHHYHSHTTPYFPYYHQDGARPAAALPSCIPQRGGRTRGHHGHVRSKPYIVKPIQKRPERRRDATSSATPRVRSGTPNLFYDQPRNATPSSSGQVHTPLANFEASFDGIAALGFDLDAFGSNERLMANSSTTPSSV